MNRMLVSLVCVSIAAALLLAEHSLLVRASLDVTAVCGTIGSDATWTAANSPYEICSLGATISPGTTISIQPDVTVQFQSGGRLANYGALLAAGTPAQPITFTGVITTPGSWAGIYADSVLITPALTSLSYATIEYAGQNISTGAQVVLGHAVLTMTHSLLRNGSGHGIYASGSYQLDIQHTQLLDNNGSALHLNQPAAQMGLASLTAAGNELDAVYIGGSTYYSGQRVLPDPGLPYVIDGVLGNFAGASLSIAPGSELQFTSLGWLNIAGEFKAIGLPGAPITLTGQTNTPGGWNGLVLYGVQVPASAQLDYVTIEYGGRTASGGNITVDYGYLIAKNTLIRHSQNDGVRINTRGRANLSNSQIVGNPSYGIRNTQTSLPIIATNNWWGDASGPTSDIAGCSLGSGDRVSAGVLFQPVLTSTQVTAPFPLSDAPILTLTPHRWFAPANGLSKIYFDITVRDGNGAPIPGRKVKLVASAGVVTDGGITDLSGKTLAYLVSNSAGDIDVIATLDFLNSCEGAMSPSSKVTFTTPLDITELFPDSPAPYFDGNISVSPMPVVVGVPATIQVRLTNPLTLPITLDASFNIVQSGIGLAFGPIKDLIGHVIPAESSETLSATFLPVVSGHYCVEFSYTITAVGTRRVSPSMAGGSGRQQLNLSTRQAPMGSPNDKDILDRADKSWKTVEKIAPRGAKVQLGIMDLWWGWAKDVSKTSAQNLGSDPPRQDYDQLSPPEWHTWPAVQPDVYISSARAAALNAASAALADVNAYGAAAVIALDRYGGASEAHDLGWASQQASARLYYEQEMGTALLIYADRLESFVQVLVDEGETNIHITVSDVMNYQQDLAATGFTAQEIANAHMLGLSDAEIEAYRQEIIAADPNELAGNVLDMYRHEAAVSRELGNALLQSSNFSPGFSVGGSPGMRIAAAPGNSLAQIDDTIMTLPVGNPLPQTALIDVRVRRIDLPADWIVSVSPAQVSLGPGEQTTVTVSILTGSLVHQYSMPRVAVEAYTGSQLLGGVVVEIVVPGYVLFDGKYHTYLPLLAK